MTPNIYLNFPGTAAEALDLYAAIFGTEVTHRQRMAEIPDMDCPPGVEEKIMHARLQIGAMTLMVSDHIEAFAGPFPGYGGFSIQLGVETPEAAQALFDRLSDGGEVRMAMAPTFWARAFGMCTDRFGVPWMVNCD